VIHRAERETVPDLRKRGVEEASGEVIAIIEEHCLAAPDWLARTLDAMQRQLAQMTTQANEARSLAGGGQGVTPTGGALRDALAKSLADNNMPPAQVQVVGSAVQIQLKNASFPAWTVWLDDARKQFKVQVSEAHITALKPDGQVDLTASLQPAQAQ